jgi:hypothetical protein
MTAQIFIENATNTNFTLNDTDNNNFGQINSNNHYSLQLNYSDNFIKKYNLLFNGGILNFTLSVNGELQGINANNQPYALLVQIESKLRPRFFNKLVITPANNIFARAKPIIYTPPVPDWVLRNDFRGW